MICRYATAALLLLLFCLAAPARAHVGSPDVFFDGSAGPYPVRITIRMPPVVPGRAEIDVSVAGKPPSAVSVLPLFSRTAIKNAPPAEMARPVPEQPNTYRGELWLMSVGAYSIEVRVRGDAGEGSVEIPVNSVATHQLPLPRLLGGILIGLAAALGFGGLAIVHAAAAESVLAPGLTMAPRQRRKGWIAAGVTAIIFAGAAVGGRAWWNADEAQFRRRLREGAWPDLAASTEVAGSQRILHLMIAERDLPPNGLLQLIPDHGKLLHLFLIREPDRDAFAHLHPVRKGNKNFDVALPPLPEGDYKVLCDLTFDNSGQSSTAMGTVHLPPPPVAADSPRSLEPDPDDSWAASSPAMAASSNTDVKFTLPDGLSITWKAHPPLQIKKDAGLLFEVHDAAGQPVALEPYMGMMAHAAVLRSDGAVFAHLHPSGNFSMAAQSFFAAKLANETGAEVMDHSKMHHESPAAGAPSSVYLPHEVPSPGTYRVWVQVKVAGQIRTAAFDAAVTP